MDQDRLLELLIKKKFNSANLEDMAELKGYLESGDYSFVDNGGLDKFPEFAAVTNVMDVETIERRWASFSKKMTLLDEESSMPAAHRGQSVFKRLVSSNIGWLNLAALVAGAVIIIGILFWNREADRPAKQNVVDTKYGSKSKIQMPDGTLVWLNSGSKLTYDDEYGKSNRTVNLIGEAFFDVKHDPDHPFLIHTANLNLKVLGTAFNVKAYPKDKLSEASLIRGSLEVSFPGRPNEKILLKPSEKIALVNSNMAVRDQSKGIHSKYADPENESESLPIISLSKVSYIASEKVVQEVSWVNNKLIFRNKTFEDLAKEMERWYDIKVEFKDKSLLNKRFTGTFKNETFIEAFDLLNETYKFKYTFNRTTNTIFLTN